MIKILVISLLIMNSSAFSCDLVNLTGSDKIAQRKAITASSDQGVRIAFNGVKSANTEFGIGGVNTTLEAYEKKLCEKIGKGQTLYKTDFKGYFVKCNTNCNEVNKKIQSIEPPKYPDSKKSLSTSNVIADNFKEGYIKARVKHEYGDPGENLSQFIDKEFKASLDAVKDLRKSKDFNSSLEKAIELYRKDKVSEIDPKLLRLVKSLDVMAEIPFVNSNDINKELDEALNKETRVSSAKTGDDLFVIIKNGDEIEKVVGADARGLGVLNISSRLEFIENYYLNNDQLKSTDDLIEISTKAIFKADTLMDKSLSTYEEILSNQIRLFPHVSLDENIALAHNKYIKAQKLDPELMDMRSGAIDDCGKDKTKILNRITSIHNRLKLFESAGIDGFFGSSCIATEYWLIKKGFKKIR